MTVRDSWPYIDSYHPSESGEHVRLKNLGVLWLLRRGFEPEDIEDERHVTAGSTNGQADLFAQRDGSTAIVEAQTQFSELNHQVGQVEYVARKNDWPVFVAAGNSMYRLVTETITEPDPHGPGEISHTYSRAVRYGDLPRVDLRAYKRGWQRREGGIRAPPNLLVARRPT